ncbi:hypothetical protein SAMN04515672_1450 [Natronorubrum texcoconense]|uniref:Uncharacterized protein n=1 Tax=Natronorubrum texcoconense TaxID=1095776 RepID=A0A1G8VPX9_9EURY|nr:hypothetical protein SAMN04515672_1450 [Natronorubrum texcoconense]
MLSFEEGHNDLKHWRQFDRSGNIQIEASFDDTFHVVERAGREQATSLEPPFRQSPTFNEAEYYINRYHESDLGPDRFQILLMFQRTENLSDVFNLWTKLASPRCPSSTAGQLPLG